MAFTTNCNPNFFRSVVNASVSYNIVNADGSITAISELDPFSDTIHNFVNSLTVFEQLQYNGENFTLTVYKNYGTTTLIWLVLMVNGLLSRTELRPGMVLKWPLLANIQAAAQVYKNNYGQVQI